MAEEKKRLLKDVNYNTVVLWGSVLMMVGLICYNHSMNWIIKENEKSEAKRGEQVFNAYITHSNRIEDYVRLDSLGATAIQAEGDFHKTTHFGMSEDFRYKQFDARTNQNTQEYYKITLYNFYKPVSEGVTFDLYQVLPELKDMGYKSFVSVDLFEIDETAYLDVSFGNDTESKGHSILKWSDGARLEEVSVDNLTFPEGKSSQEKWEALSSIREYLGYASSLGNKSLELDGNILNVSDIRSPQRVIYQEEPDLLKLSENGSYDIYFDAGKTYTNQEAEEFLNHFRQVGQTTYVDGLVMEPQKMATKDGKKHEITRFSDIEEWRYVDSELTMEDFMAREDVKAIINDPNSTLLPLGVNPLDQSLVSYDLAMGPLYMVETKYSSGFVLNLAPYSLNRPGFSSLNAYGLISFDSYVGKKELDGYLTQIGRGGGDKMIVQFYESYGAMFHKKDDKFLLNKSQRSDVKKIIDEGPDNRVYPIISVESDYIINGEVNFDKSVWSRGYLIKDSNNTDMAKPQFHINDNQVLNGSEVASSMVFVKDGKAITFKIPK